MRKKATEKVKQFSAEDSFIESKLNVVTFNGGTLAVAADKIIAIADIRRRKSADPLAYDISHDAFLYVVGRAKPFLIFKNSTTEPK